MRRSWINIRDLIIQYLLMGLCLLTIGFLTWLLVYVIGRGLPAISWDFLTTQYRSGDTGILPMIISTVYILASTLIISTPIGVMGAIYLNEYAEPSRFLDLIRLTTETLAGIPSIIYGLFGFLFFSNTLGLGYSLFSGSLTLSIMVLPTIIRTTEEALKSVPISFREGSLALGATQLTTIARVVIPAAIPGILTGIILSMGRALGETAAVYFTAGVATRTPQGIMSSGRTLSVHLYLLAKEAAPIEQSFAAAAVLVVLIVLVNYIANKMIGSIGKNYKYN